jgi:FAD/FMN-containing dehydrogenase
MNEINPNHLKDLAAEPYPLFMLFIEFEGDDRTSKKSVRAALKLLERYASRSDVYGELDDQVQQWKIREAINVLASNNEGLLHAVPLFDGAVPPERLRACIEGIHNMISANNLNPAMWGHVGDGNITVRPMLNLGQVGDRQKAFRLLDEYHKLILDLGGTIAATAGEGRLKAPYLEPMYGTELYELLIKVKQVFDPYNTLNPGVKFDTSIEDLKAIVRPDYNLSHLYTHLPRA